MPQDDDVRIYHTDEVAPTSESERSAELYLLHRDNGNLDKCRELGQLLGTTFVGESARFAGDPLRRHKLVLLSFLISDELAGIIFDPMLQPAVTSAFGQVVEQCDVTLSQEISDSTAYTMYMLEDRSGGTHLGATFAELCGQPEDAVLAAVGNALEVEYRKLYADIISSYTFVSV